MDQEEVRFYASYRSWHCWHTGCDSDVFGTGADTEPDASQTPFMEEGARR